MIQRPQTTLSNDNGFTLVELALVITVVGLLLSFGISAWMSMKTSQQISAANATLKTVANCLINYTIHSETIPTDDFFDNHCVANDPWGEKIVYYYNDLDDETTNIAWVLVSRGPNTNLETTLPASILDCSLGDDLCHSTSKNTLIYEINK